MNRELFALQHEGSLIEYAGKAGKQAAGDHGRAMIDGLASALIRLEGAEGCAPYFLALGDRVCGGMKALTLFRAPPQQFDIAPEAAAASPEPPSAALAGTEVTGYFADEVGAAAAAPGQPAEEEDPPAFTPSPSEPAWRRVLALLLIVLTLALAWRAGFVAGRSW